MPVEKPRPGAGTIPSLTSSGVRKSEPKTEGPAKAATEAPRQAAHTERVVARTTKLQEAATSRSNTLALNAVSAASTHLHAAGWVDPLFTTRPVEPKEQFRFSDYFGDRRCDLEMGGGSAPAARVSFGELENIKVPLQMVNGSLRGSVDVEGQVLDLKFTRRQGVMDVTYGGATSKLEIRDPQVGTRFVETATRLFQQDLAEHIAGLQQDPTLSAEQKRAIAQVGEMQEGPVTGTFGFIKKLRESQKMTPSEATQAPFDYAIATCNGQAKSSCENLAENIRRLHSKYEGTPAGRVLASALTDYAKSGEKDADETKLVLAAALRIAKTLAVEERPTDKYTLDCFRYGLRNSTPSINFDHPAAAKLTAGLGTRVLSWLQDALPPDHPIYSVLEKNIWGLSEADEKKLWPEAVVTRNALAMGVLRRWMDKEEVPPSNALDFTGMPTIRAVQAFDPIMIREASPPSPKADTLGGWQEVGQGFVGDCWYVAGEASIAETRPELQAQTIKALTTIDDDDNVERRYRVNMFVPDKEGTLYPQEQWVDGRLYASAVTEEFSYAGDRKGSIDPKSPGLWLALKEKAYAFRRTGAPAYSSIEGGRPRDLYDTVFGKGHGFEKDTSKVDADTLVVYLRRIFAHSLPCAAGTHPNRDDYKDSPVIANHGYILLGLKEGPNGTEIRLANLHKPRDAAPPTDGSVPKIRGEFTLTPEEFHKRFAAVDWCKLPKKVTPESLARAGLERIEDLK